jgi:glycosyltransferase involved in cell wall biosynthesis
VKSLKIVAHNGAAVFGGGEKAAALLLSGLQARGHQVVLYCRDEARAARFAAYGIDSRIFSIGGDTMVPNAFRFAKRLRAERPDVLLLTTFKKIWLAGMAGQLARVPRVVVRIGLSTDVARNWKYRVAFHRWVNAIVTNSREMQGALAGTLRADFSGDIVALPTGVMRPATAASPGSLRATLGIPADAPLIGTLARLAKQKRLERLLDALELLPDVHCAIAGEGPHEQLLREHAATVGVQTRVHWLGHREDVATVLQDLDVFVLTSQTEGLSNAMLEALSLGVPVVSTPVNGAAEALHPFADGNAPGVISGFDAGSIAHAIEPIVRNRQLATAMRTAAVRRWEEHFGYERMLDAWEVVLRGSGRAS